MNALSLVLLLVLAVWWIKPLRDFLVQRTNRTVKVLLVVFPLLAVGRVGYRLITGQQEFTDMIGLVVVGLLLLWGALIWLGNWLERRRPTQVRPPDLATLSKLPGMPRVPSAVTSPQAQQAARAAAQAAARVDWDNVATGAGRTAGRWAAKLRKGMNSANTR